jgi:hypothetical protein
MKKTVVGFFVIAAIAGAQSFQPPSWGQGQSHGSIQDQISQLQSQIQKLRAQQRALSNPPVESQTGPVTGHPVSGKETRHTTQKLEDGTELSRTDTSYFYRDSAGRMRAEGPNGVEIFDPAAHVAYRLLTKQKTYSHSFFSGDVSFVSIAAYGNSTSSSIHSGSGTHVSAPPQGETEDLGRQMVNGVMAKGSRVTITIPAGTIGNNRDIKVVNERWYSDDLQVLIKSVNTDPRFGVNSYELTDIKQTEPDISLFRPPADYRLSSGEHR